MLCTLQVHSEEARQESLERLSGWLDTVETHLVREIAARTGKPCSCQNALLACRCQGTQMEPCQWLLSSSVRHVLCSKPAGLLPCRTSSKLLLSPRPCTLADSFFDGSGYIQDVRGTCARLYQQVAGLRQQVGRPGCCCGAVMDVAGLGGAVAIILPAWC